MTKAIRKVPKQALPGVRANMFLMDPFDLTIVGLDTKDGEGHPLYDERVKLELSESFIRNIMVHGVLEPVLVRKDGERVQVVDGRQRVRAAREATGRREREGADGIKVPCVVRRGEDHSMASIAISANEQRHDDTVLSRARRCARYLALGRTEEEAAIAYGVSGQTITNWLVLAELHREVQDMIERGEVSAARAVNLCKGLPRAKHVDAVKVVDKPKRGRPSGPSRATIRHVALAMKDDPKVHPEFKKAILFALGELSAKDAGVERFLCKDGG